MAKNDLVLLDSLLHPIELNSKFERGEVFERFVLEQVLKNFDLSNDEIDFGWTDGSLDGGIDGFYILVNGRLLTDTKDFPWPRSSADLQIILITCKHHDTFQQAPLDAMLASFQELFDLSRATSSLDGRYSGQIRQCRDLFIAAFRQLSLHRPTISINVIYASRGSADMLGESVGARANQLVGLLHSYFSASTATFTPVGAAELVEMHRQVKSFALDLPVQECLTAGEEGYVVLARLTDYNIFVSDEKQQLRRYLFDSNVRAYLGGNLVNADISNTLANSSAPSFWWLNNGVTILATSASLVGKTLKLKDIQIVNGLQTTESIHRHFLTSAPVDGDLRSLLIKVIISQDENVRDQVIRATNNQSLVEPAALHATDRTQRDIEEILLRHDWYYERRTNFFKNEGRPDSRIISPLVLASGSVALLLKNPVKSSKLKQRQIRMSEAYQAVYSETFPLDVWPVVAALVKGSELAILRSPQIRSGGRGHFVSAWRGPLAYFTAARVLGTFSYSLRELVAVKISQVTDEYISETWSTITAEVRPARAKKLKTGRLDEVAIALKSKWGLAGEMNDGKRELPVEQLGSIALLPETETNEFLATVSSALPPQPWKPGVHVMVGQKLGEKPKRVSRAIQILIERGDWMQQRDGVVFDPSGKEILRDESRAPAKHRGEG